MLNTVNVFGFDVPVRTHYCSRDGETPADVIVPYTAIYARVTNVCQAACKFCEFHGKNKQEFNTDTFKNVYTEVSRKMKIKRFNFTGGEPTIRADLIREILPFIKDLDKNTEVTINTNGYDIESLYDMLDYVDSVSMSRHHYDDNINAKIFGMSKCPFPTDKIAKFPKKSILNFTCNLMREHINSADECHKYVETFSSLGVTSFGFVSLMNVNDYTRDNVVDFESLHFADRDNVLNNIQWNKGKACKCHNYLVYNKDGVISKVYAKFTMDLCKHESLMFYSDNILRMGFSGPIVFDGSGQ
jgi:molybdenum cofactor biosynthesis enzyme MoaA